MSQEVVGECIDYQTVDFDHIIYNKPRKEHGRYIGKIKYKVVGKKAHQKLIIKTPRLKCIEDLKITEDRCAIELQLFNNNVDFYQFLIKFDDKNITTAYRNRNEWFGKDFPLDIIDEFYKPVLKMNSNKCPTIKVKLLYDELKNFDLELLKKDSELIFYIECVGLRFLTQQFTMIWKLNHFTLPPQETNSSSGGGDDDYYESGLIDRDEVLSDVISNESSEDYEEPDAPKVDTTSVVVDAAPKVDTTSVVVDAAPKEAAPKVETAVVVDAAPKEAAPKEVEPKEEVSKEEADVMEKVEREIDKLEARLARVEEGGKKVAGNKKKVIKCANNRRRIWL